MHSRYTPIRSISTVCLLALLLTTAGCSAPPPGTPATANKALDAALRMMYAVRERVGQQHFDVAAERAYDVSRHLSDARLNGTPDIQSMREQWTQLRSELGSGAPPRDFAERLNALIERIEPLVAEEEGGDS